MRPLYQRLRHTATYAVYKPGSGPELLQVLRLQQEGRVQGLGPADYRAGNHTALHLSAWVRTIAERIAARREQALGDLTGTTPEHIVESPARIAGAREAEAPPDEVASRSIASPEPSRLRDPSTDPEEPAPASTHEPT